MTNQQQPFPGQQPPAYPGAVPPVPTKPKKPWFKKWWVWVLIVILLIGVGSAMGGKGSSDTAKPAGSQSAAAKPAETKAPAKPKDRLTLDDGWKIDKSDGFAVYVNGYVSNNTDKPVNGYVQVTFSAVDAHGANVGDCLANANTIDANGKWKFKAICTGEAKEIETVRFKELTGF